MFGAVLVLLWSCCRCAIGAAGDATNVFVVVGAVYDFLPSLWLLLLSLLLLLLLVLYRGPVVAATVYFRAFVRHGLSLALMTPQRLGHERNDVVGTAINFAGAFWYYYCRCKGVGNEMCIGICNGFGIYSADVR